MFRSQRGHAMVEFALAFPIFTFLCLVALDVAFLAVQQFSLERRCSQVARELCLGPWVSQVELEAQARRLVGDEETAVQVRLRPLPSRPPGPLQAVKTAEVVEILLQKNPKPIFPLLSWIQETGFLKLRSRGREARVRSDRGN